jgi:hypothetical protein
MLGDEVLELALCCCCDHSLQGHNLSVYLQVASNQYSNLVKVMPLPRMTIDRRQGPTQSFPHCCNLNLPTGTLTGPSTASWSPPCAHAAQKRCCT